jgi:hypothetical protein
MKSLSLKQMLKINFENKFGKVLLVRKYEQKAKNM